MFYPPPAPHLPAIETTTLSCFDFSFFLSRTVILNRSPTSFSFCSFFVVVVVIVRLFFCVPCLFSLFFSCSCVCLFSGVGCVWICVCVCVFSPAASVDYGSFADRCSTWLELLRLKAHTIRRGSVKTSRRTQSLAHSGDHTHKYRTRFQCRTR